MINDCKKDHTKLYIIKLKSGKQDWGDATKECS